MSYDRDSFLAGLAVGRTLWRPHRDYGGGKRYFYRIKRSDIDEASSNRWILYGTWNGNQFSTAMGYPDTNFSGEVWDMANPQYKSLTASWVADSDYSWSFTYDSPIPLSRTDAGISALYISTVSILEGFRSATIVPGTLYFDLTLTVGGEQVNLRSYHTTTYIPQTPGVVDLTGCFPNLSTTNRLVTRMEGSFYLPTLELYK